MAAASGESFALGKKPSVSLEEQLRHVYSGATTTPTVKTTLLFSLSDKPGQLSKVLNVFQEKSINLSGIRSRPSHKENYEWEFTVDINLPFSDPSMQEAIQQASEIAHIRVLGSDQISWFPRKLWELDDLSQDTYACGEELAADHPGFLDQEYRRRRQVITEISKGFKISSGEPIPRIEYTETEIKTWGIVYRALQEKYPTHACRAHRCVFPLLEKFCGYSENNIPQLQDISVFLQQCTGWRLKPVTGLLTPRDFLHGLAFRVFHSTQYIRHHSVPLYTPEPDVCHELLGHVPLFADPDFAELSQLIGLASLGASDEEVNKLATVYWFTVEFGLCMEDGQRKAYGAGLLSSFGELEYCLSDKPKLLEFDPFVACVTPYPITEYQPVYFVASSFADAARLLKKYALSLNRPFGVSYNALTQSVEVLDTIESVRKRMVWVQRELTNLNNALAKLGDKY